MPAQIMTSVENNFTRGLITESTGLNFPENAATDASNCVFTLIGDVTRRLGINQELNGTPFPTISTNQAISTYVWNNPGGDGNSKLLVKQIASNLFFYNIATATTAAPLSTQRLASQVGMLGYADLGPSSFDVTKECQYADGNGYLFVYHPSCDPFYVVYDPNTLLVTSFRISVTIRDFVGVIDSLNVNTRPATLSAQHNYNLNNQGWISGNPWFMESSTSYALGATGSTNFTVPSGVAGVTNGQTVKIEVGANGTNPFVTALGQASVVATGTVTNYTGTTITINITSTPTFVPPALGQSDVDWWIIPISSGYINTFFTATGVYPSNSDVWWYFKNASGAFDPATTITNVTASAGQAPQGHFLLNAWVQSRSSASGITGITTVQTSNRPTTGTWFQGRVWFTGVNAQQQAVGDANNYTWTENIYFSQIVTTTADFGACYQTNDPTSEQLNTLLPTDGGVITIPSTGTIYKLFPIVNGMLVFASNGVWFITGSQGIGFAANDYTVTKISSVKSISNTSFVDVLGLPYFWNEEGIYKVTANQGGQLTVDPITVGTILSFYSNIPLSSRKYVRGDYDPINYVIQWSYSSTDAVSAGQRYVYDSILNYNTYNKAFYPYSISSAASNSFIHGVNYISYPFINNTTPQSGFKYNYSFNNGAADFHGFAEEYDTTYLDWSTANYTSTFTVGFKLLGRALTRFQLPYVVVYSRNSGYAAYYIQGLWDFANTSDSNRWSVNQFTEINSSNQSMVFRRHRIRGRGNVLQLRFTSVQGQAFDIMGWAIDSVVNQGV